MNKLLHQMLDPEETLTMTEPHDDIHGRLRERVSVVEAVVEIHKDMLKEVRDAVMGINTSLRVLTLLDERMVQVQESSSSTRQRIVDIEDKLHEVSEKSSLNEHGRGVMEKVGYALLAAGAGGAGAFFFTYVANHMS